MYEAGMLTPRLAAPSAQNIPASPLHTGLLR